MSDNLSNVFGGSGSELVEANFANPTAEVGLTAVNGTSTDAMRSDAAPALDQGIAPTWTSEHIFLDDSGATDAYARIVGNVIESYVEAADGFFGGAVRLVGELVDQFSDNVAPKVEFGHYDGSTGTRTYSKWFQLHPDGISLFGGDLVVTNGNGVQFDVTAGTNVKVTATDGLLDIDQSLNVQGDANVAGDLAVTGEITGKAPYSAHTSGPVAVTAAQSGTTFATTGGTAVTFNLPAGVTDKVLRYSVIRLGSAAATIVPDGAIRDGATIGTDVVLGAVGSNVLIEVYPNGDVNITSKAGTVTVTEP